jgi:hypothetical protein
VWECKYLYPYLHTYINMYIHVFTYIYIYIFMNIQIYMNTYRFKVKPAIALISKQRMMDTGIGLDFISLSQPPLHFVPLFLFDCKEEGLGDFYVVPQWINVCYVDCRKDSSATGMYVYIIYIYIYIHNHMSRYTYTNICIDIYIYV